MISKRLLSQKLMLVCLGLAAASSIMTSRANTIEGQDFNEFIAVLSTETLGHGSLANHIEMISLSSRSTEYVFAMDYPEPSFCSPWPGECSIVLWGYSGIAPRPSSLRQRNKELFHSLVELKPFRLKQYYPPLLDNGGTEGWFDIRMKTSQKTIHKNVIAEFYYAFDKQNEFYPVFNYMRSLKKDIIFFSHEQNLLACVRELKDPTIGSTFGASPHWKKVRLAMISYLAVSNYQSARPLFEQLLETETDNEIVAKLKAALRLLKK